MHGALKPRGANNSGADELQMVTVTSGWPPTWS